MHAEEVEEVFDAISYCKEICLCGWDLLKLLASHSCKSHRFREDLWCG